MLKKNKDKFRPAVIGLGYVGLPILLNLEKKYFSLGFDISKERVNNLNRGNDIFGEFEKKKTRKKKS